MSEAGVSRLARQAEAPRGEGWCGRRESKPADSGSQPLAHQFASYLAGAGDVAGDAQIDMALAAIGVLRVFERELEVDAHVKASESGPLPRLPAGAGVSGLSQTGERQIQDVPDRGSPSCSSPQGACLDGSGGRGVRQFESLKWRDCERCGGLSEPDEHCCQLCGCEWEASS
jgi:hypothetical protein